MKFDRQNDSEPVDSRTWLYKLLCVLLRCKSGDDSKL